MLHSANELSEILKNIPDKYWNTIIEYAKIISVKASKNELSDTEYLNSIPGMPDSIVKEAETDLSKYSENLDW